MDHRFQSTRRVWLRRALGAGACLAVTGSAEAKAFNWKVVQVEGRDYVTLDDIKRFYDFAQSRREGRSIRLISGKMNIRFTAGAEVILINDFKFCLCYPELSRDGTILISRMDLAKLLDPIIRPSFIGTGDFDTVVVDAGHGGHDSGAKGRHGVEKDYTLDTSLRLERALTSMGYKVKMTRSTDIFITLGGRVAIANAVPRSIFVSVHFNSSGASGAGLETYALAPQGTANTSEGLKESDLRERNGNSQDSENIALATAVHASMVHRLDGLDRGVKRDRFSVISGVQRPGILVEGGFVTNPVEGALIHRPDHRQKLAEAIANGVNTYRGAVRRRAGVPRRSVG